MAAASTAALLSSRTDPVPSAARTAKKPPPKKRLRFIIAPLISCRFYFATKTLEDLRIASRDWLRLYRTSSPNRYWCSVLRDMWWRPKYLRRAGGRDRGKIDFSSKTLATERKSQTGWRRPVNADRWLSLTSEKPLLDAAPEKYEPVSAPARPCR